jgi:hypothetical protein
MINSLVAVISISTILSQLNGLNNIGSGLLLGITGAFTWLIQKYFSFLTAAWSSQSEANELAGAIRADISTTIDNYRASFTPEGLEKSKKLVEEMHKQKKPRAMLLASTSDNFVYEAMRKDFTKLPANVFGPVTAYYTADQLFDACYKLLATQEFVRAPLDAKKKSIDDNYEASQEAIAKGDIAIGVIDTSSENIKRWKFLIAIGHVLVVIALYQWSKINVNF